MSPSCDTVSSSSIAAASQDDSDEDDGAASGSKNKSHQQDKSSHDNISIKSSVSRTSSLTKPFVDHLCDDLLVLIFCYQLNDLLHSRFVSRRFQQTSAVLNHQNRGAVATPLTRNTSILHTHLITIASVCKRWRRVLYNSPIVWERVAKLQLVAFPLLFRLCLPNYGTTMPDCDGYPTQRTNKFIARIRSCCGLDAAGVPQVSDHGVDGIDAVRDARSSEDTGGNVMDSPYSPCVFEMLMHLPRREEASNTEESNRKSIRNYISSYATIRFASISRTAISRWAIFRHRLTRGGEGTGGNIAMTLATAVGCLSTERSMPEGSENSAIITRAARLGSSRNTSRVELYSESSNRSSRDALSHLSDSNDVAEVVGDSRGLRLTRVTSTIDTNSLDSSIDGTDEHRNDWTVTRSRYSRSAYLKQCQGRRSTLTVQRAVLMRVAEDLQEFERGFLKYREVNTARIYVLQTLICSSLLAFSVTVGIGIGAAEGVAEIFASSKVFQIFSTDVAFKFGWLAYGLAVSCVLTDIVMRAHFEPRPLSERIYGNLAQVVAASALCCGSIFVLGLPLFLTQKNVEHAQFASGAGASDTKPYPALLCVTPILFVTVAWQLMIGQKNYTALVRWGRQMIANASVAQIRDERAAGRGHLVDHGAPPALRAVLSSCLTSLSPELVTTVSAALSPTVFAIELVAVALYFETGRHRYITVFALPLLYIFVTLGVCFLRDLLVERKAVYLIAVFCCAMVVLSASLAIFFPPLRGLTLLPLFFSSCALFTKQANELRALVATVDHIDLMM